MLWQDDGVREIVRIVDQVVVIYFKVDLLARHFLGGTEKHSETPQSI